MFIKTSLFITTSTAMLQLISDVFRHSMWRLQEIHALESVVFYIAGHTNHKFPVYTTQLLFTTV